MKTKLVTILFVLLSAILEAQSPSAFNYQAVVRDASGKIRANSPVTVRCEILIGEEANIQAYSEEFETSTNEYGLINLQVGKGKALQGTFNTIDWGASKIFLKVNVDNAEMGMSEILSVPYALYSNYAKYAANGFSGNYNDLTGKPALATVATSGSYNDLKNKPSVFSGDYKDLVNKPTIVDTVGNNIATGFQANYSNTTGLINMAIGHQSLYSNTSGYYNIAIGYKSLYSHLEEDCNIAIGHLSLYSSIDSKHNLAVGNSSLYSNKWGSFNTVIGHQSLYFNQAGDYNVGIGYKVLYSNNGGANNVAVGFNSLYANTTASGNTAIGKNAMDSQVTGSNNTAIGFNSDVSNGVINATAIGSEASVSSSNRIVLGNSSVTSIGGYASWTNYSDRRLKENIIYTNSLGLNFITKLKPVTYNYISDVNKHKRNGLIAQDVQQTLTDLGIDFSGLVIEDNENKTMNLSYSEFVLPLITAVQELNQKNQNLESEMTEMKARIETLEKMIKSK